MTNSYSKVTSNGQTRANYDIQILKVGWAAPFLRL